MKDTQTIRMPAAMGKTTSMDTVKAYHELSKALKYYPKKAVKRRMDAAARQIADEIMRRDKAETNERQVNSAVNSAVKDLFKNSRAYAITDNGVLPVQNPFKK